MMYANYYHRLQFLMEILDLTLQEGIDDGQECKEELCAIREDPENTSEDQDTWSMGLKIVEHFTEQFRLMHEHVQFMEKALVTAPPEEEAA